MGGFGNIARGLGQVGSDIGTGAASVAEQRRKALEDRWNRLQMQIQFADWQQRAKQEGLPKYHSTFTTPDGSVYAIMTDPQTGQPSTRQIHRGSEKYPEFSSLQQMESWAITHGDAALLKQAQDAIKATQREPSVPATTQEYQDYVKALGHTPSAKEILEFRRNPPKGETEGGADAVEAYAEDVSSRRITISQVPAKVRGDVLRYLKKNKMALLPQLPGSLQDKLSQREAAIDNTLAIMKDLDQDADLLEKLPSASLVAMAQSADRIPQVLTRFFGVFQSDKEKLRIDRLAGNLRSLQEHINILRAPLGATGFRGHEGWAALQAQSVQALAAPGVNKQVLKNTMSVLKKLRDATDKVLTGEEPEAEDTPEDKLNKALDKLFPTGKPN